jgi:hypothetical protein
MNKHPKLKDSLTAATLIFVLSAVPALAYVDPGSGSVIVTTILGLFAAIGYTFRRYFYKLRRMFRSGDEPSRKDRFSGDD